MSEKSDRDNRSNQLNSNNSAYHSSRGGRSGGDDEYYDSRYVMSSFINYSFLTETRPVVKCLTYFVDLLDFKSNAYVFRFKAEVPRPSVGVHFTDPSKIAEEVLASISAHIEKVTGSALIFSQVRRGGSRLDWLGTGPKSTQPMGGWSVVQVEELGIIHEYDSHSLTFKTWLEERFPNQSAC